MGGDTVEGDVKKTVAAFEAALEARPFPVAEPAVDRILLAVDGSNQEPFSEALALHVSGALGASLHVTYAYRGAAPDVARDRHLQERSAALGAHGTPLSSSRHAGGGEPFEQILSIATAERCRLIVLPSPYLADVDVLGHDSVGSTLEMLIARSAIPLLVARQPRADVARLFGEVLLPLLSLPAGTALAAGWALRLATAGGSLRLLAVMDPAEIQSVRELLGDAAPVAIDDAVLERLAMKRNADVIAEMQKRCLDRGLGCRVSTRLGAPAAMAAAFSNEADRLAVVGCLTEDATSVHERVIAFIRESSNPVLVAR